MALNGEQSKIGSIFQTIGAILLFISFFLIFIGLGLIPGFSPDQNFLNYGMFLIAPAFFILFLSVLTSLNKDIKKFESFTTIKCENTSCKHTIVRDFKINDFIFKKLDKKCPKCQSNMYIVEISSFPVKKIKELPEKGINPKKPKISKKEKKLKTITTLKCKNIECDFKKTRNFKIYDYIFKSFSDESCPRCGSVLYISNISHKDPETS
ncbi:MAG: hypothetical protein ACTSO9_06755 [Candidatus Helarchaeota archaeon]